MRTTVTLGTFALVLVASLPLVGCSPAPQQQATQAQAANGGGASPGRDAGGSGGTGTGATSANTGGPANINEWNHEDLRKHLASKGLDLGMKKKGERAVYLYEKTEKNLQADAGSYLSTLFGGSQTIAIVTLAESPQQARDLAGLHGEKGCAYGRFVIEVSPHGDSLLRKIQAALK